MRIRETKFLPANRRRYMTFGKMSRMGDLFNKIITYLLIHAFLFSNIAFALPQEKLADSTKQEIITDPEKIVIPRDAGIVKSKYIGKGGRLVIHSQDAHCNFEAQS